MAISLQAGCNDRAEPTEQAPPTSVEIDPGPQQITEAQAWQIVRDSRVYADALSWVEDRETVHLTLEEVDQGDYIFWMWGDRGTHGTTMERIRVASDGKLFRMGEVDGDWGHWLAAE